MDNNTAYRIRFERGLKLPVDVEYDDPRMREIARRQKELLDELDELDKEIKKLGE